MKRGLVKLDPAETGPEVFLARLDALRFELREHGSSLGLIYGDVSRSSGIDYLTNFCLYWNEAVLAVPVDSSAALLTKLSKRVQPWITRTTILHEIRSGPRLADNIAAFVEDRLGTRAGVRVALNDMGWWPHALVAGLKAAMPEAELRDFGGATRNLRVVPDAEEMALLRDAGRLLDAAVAAAWTNGAGADDRIGIAVREARLSGFLDVEVVSKRLTDGTEYIDAIGQYRYVWVRLCRPRNGAMGDRAQAALHAAVDGIRAGVTETRLMERVQKHVDGDCRWAFACMRQTDIETKGVFRPAEDLDRPFREGEVVAPVLTCFRSHDVAVAAETVVVGRDGAQLLTAAGGS